MWSWTARAAGRFPGRGRSWGDAPPKPIDAINTPGGIGIQGDHGTDVRIVLPAAVAGDLDGDGEQAMQRLVRSRPGPPQLVLLDLKMPRMDGLEVLGRIRADEGLQRLPVVVLTSSERPEDREEALRHGATWFVCKPTDGRRLHSEIQQLGDRWAQVGA